MTLPLLCVLQACTPNQHDKSPNVPSSAQVVQNGATAVAPMSKPAGVWIDVRSAEEYGAGHLSDALHMPHGEIADKIAAAVPDKNTPIHLYCRSGHRAEVALQELKKLGYTNLTNHGGYEDLLKKGLK